MAISFFSDFLKFSKTANYEANMLPVRIEDKYLSVYSIVDQTMRGLQNFSAAEENVHDVETARTQETSLTKDIKEKVERVHASLQSWNARYDYSLWERVEDYFNDIWLELECLLYLCVEYELYDELRKIFIELRNFLHTTGRVRERLYFASWLFRKARRRDDRETELFALSTIVWSHTCTGYYQDIEKAAQLWEFLMHRILNHDVKIQPREREFNTIVQDSTDGPISPELFLEAYESGVRIYIRQNKLDSAWLQTGEFDRLINNLSQKKLISSRLRTRCKTAKAYHRGIILYLRKDFNAARKTFEDIYRQSARIRWERVQRGAQSWLATVAKEQNRLDECNIILSKVGVSDDVHQYDASEHNIHRKLRDAFLHLIKADLEGKRGQIDIKLTHQKEANRIFEEYSSCNQSQEVSFGPQNLLMPKSR